MESDLPGTRTQGRLTSSLALNGIEFNLARAVGPALGGLIIAIAGVGTVFLLNVLSFLGVIVVIARWKRPVPKATLPAETFTGATSAAFRYVRYSPGIQRLLLRSARVFRRISNPQDATSCTISAYFGSPRGLVSCCKTKSG